MTAMDCRHIRLPERSGDGCRFLYLWFLARAAGVYLSALERIQQPTPELLRPKEKQQELMSQRASRCPNPAAAPRSPGRTGPLLSRKIFGGQMRRRSRLGQILGLELPAWDPRTPRAPPGVCLLPPARVIVELSGGPPATPRSPRRHARWQGTLPQAFGELFFVADEGN